MPLPYAPRIKAGQIAQENTRAEEQGLMVWGVRGGVHTLVEDPSVRALSWHDPIIQSSNDRMIQSSNGQMTQ
eukprot:352958-Chlamydomonas_euryale.AAC.5